MRGNIGKAGSKVGAWEDVYGNFTRLDYPSVVAVGDEIEIVVDGNLYDPSRSHLARWVGCFTAEGGGMKDCACFSGLGQAIGPETAATLRLSPMPEAPITITVKLWGTTGYVPPDERPPGF